MNPDYQEPGHWTDFDGHRHTNGASAFDAVQADYDGEAS